MIPGDDGHRKIHNGALDGFEKRCESFMKWPALLDFMVRIGGFR